MRVEKRVLNDALRVLGKGVCQGVMCYVEQCKLLHSLVSKILVFEDRLEIEPNVDGIKSLLIDAGVKVKK